jgi:protein-L-isoaspartate(D-aspartate) O-methyltransferase
MEATCRRRLEELSTGTAALHFDVLRVPPGEDIHDRHMTRGRIPRMTDFEHARRTMVDNQLRTSNVTDRRVLSVMGRVPRERFVPVERQAIAYIDDSHRFGAGPDARCMMAPAPFGKLLQLAEIEPEDAILDIGSASGYSVAVLAGLGRDVTGLEPDPELVSRANANLTALGIVNARVLEGDFVTSPKGMYDVIVIEGTVETVPERLFSRLNEDGRLVALLQKGATATANIYVRSGGSVTARAEFNTSAPPLNAVRHDNEFIF